MDIFSFFRPRCPACNRRVLKGRPDKQVVEGMKDGLRANPAWLWWECVRCGARFKERHYGDGALDAVEDEEWQANSWSQSTTLASSGHSLPRTLRDSMDPTLSRCYIEAT